MTSRLIIAVIILLAIAVSCSDRREPTALPSTHPVEWMDASAVDFHGTVTVRYGTAGCIVCHGDDLDGGRVDVSCIECHTESGVCISCHGGLDNQTGAPPFGLEGETSDTALGVGAHTVHLEGSGLARPVGCTTCHRVPVSLLEPSHLDFDTLGMPTVLDSIAELNFTGLADTSGATTTWDRTARTCTDSYCHGNFGGGNSSNQPVWTSGSAPCGSCHDAGSNPASLGWKHEFHVVTGELHCSECHADVIDPNGTIIAPEMHVNGAADVAYRDQAVCDACHGGTAGCVLCHGGVDNQTGAPPEGLEGETETTELAVGAHTIHLEGGSLADAFDCAECHTVPDSMLADGHLDGDNIAELNFGALAGASTSWNRASATCTNNYCHGNFAGGYATNEPVWTSGNAPCGSCHDVGDNPSDLGWKHEVHVESFTVPCSECHGAVVDLTENIIDRSLHVNGVADTLTNQSTCDLCHGDSQPACYGCHGGIDNQTGAPPRGLEGETDVTQLAVGAHTAHIEGGSISDGVLCEDCHLVPQYFGDPGHFDVDSVAELTFSSLSGGATWNRAGATCADSYCHGNFAGGNSGSLPVWTNAATGACGTCHDDGSNPNQLSGQHDEHANEGIACYRCHDGVLNSSDQIDGFALHVDGIKDVDFSSGGTWANGECSGTGCHGRESW